MWDALIPLVQVSGTIAVLINILLIFVLIKYSSKTIGFYKWLLVMYSVYEVFYASTVILTVPTHTIVGNSWVVFTYNGVVENAWGPALYCGFYLLWIYHLTVMFGYRYVVVTKPTWVNRIQGSVCLKFFLIALYLLLAIYCFVCGLYFCSRNPMTGHIRQEIYEKFGVWEPGYIALDYHSTFGIISFSDHHTFLLAAIIIVPFCAIKVWKKIINLQKGSIYTARSQAELQLSRQIVFTLVAQTVPPFCLYIFPSLFLFTYPIWPDGVFGIIPHLLSIFTTIPKILDPLMVFCFVQDYRRAILKMLRSLRGVPVASVGQVATVSENVPA